ncbi:MAG TPA: radical SAM family heme chaperone HemW [Opitutaceae bacterium]|nr:radical SAM family heme chaperone HemW [Opitutaceae bacterium]
MLELAIAQAKARRTPALGLYVHVPFCASTCDFCAFYQIKPTAERVHRFLDGVAHEAGLAAWNRAADTVFWGGGTPGLLSARALAELGEIVRRCAGGQPQEWSVELAPASVTPERLAALKDVGVTRISLGVQSFQPALLEALGRRHTLPQVRRAYQWVRAAGFSSVNLDLIFAIPGQDLPAWRTDLQEAIRVGPDHVSTYCLTFEEDAALFVKLAQGRVRPDVEKEAAFYTEAWERLEAAGYRQYEVSNFARRGHHCRHNLNTWRMEEWIGLGPSAASQCGGWRGSNVADLDQWLADVAGSRRAQVDRVALTPRLLAEDSLIFGLRMNEGVNVPELRARFPGARWENLCALADRLVEEGLAIAEPDGRLRLTLRGRLVADAVGEQIMEAMAETAPVGANRIA